MRVRLFEYSTREDNIGVPLPLEVRHGRQMVERIEVDATEDGPRTAPWGYRGIENSLHWQLDVTLGEVQCRVREGHADTNLSLLRRTALRPLKRQPTAKVGINNKRVAAGRNETYLAQVPFGPQLETQSS